MAKPKKRRERNPKTNREYEEQLNLFAEGIGGSAEPQKPGIGSYPPHLKGLGVRTLAHPRGFRGSANLPPGPVKRYSEEERAEYERELRERGDLE